jgi:hypothetical protein
MERRQHAPVSQSGGGGPQQSKLLVPGAVNKQGADTQVEEEGRCGTRRRPPQPSQADSEAGQVGRTFCRDAGDTLVHDIPDLVAERGRAGAGTKSAARARRPDGTGRVAPTQMVARLRDGLRPRRWLRGRERRTQQDRRCWRRWSEERARYRPQGWLAPRLAKDVLRSEKEELGPARRKKWEEKIYVTGEKKAHS